MLDILFGRQRELMNTYHEIESKSGIFNYQDGDIPVDLNSLAGQARIKHLAWYVIEEVAESLEVGTKAHRRVEVIDALHFFIELVISSGYDWDLFDPLWIQFNRLQDFTPEYSEDAIARAVMRITSFLGWAMNLLKNKPWKQGKPVDVKTGPYQAYLNLTMYHLLELLYLYEVRDPQRVVDLYLGKSDINQHRQESGY